MSIEAALRAIKDAVLDLQAADYNTYQRPLERLSLALDRPELRAVVTKLRAGADFEAFLAAADRNEGSLGSGQLKWPSDVEQEFGLVVHLIDRAAQDPNWFLDFAHTFFYSGRKIVGDIRAITKAVIVPFNRDFAAYIEDLAPVIVSLDESGATSIENDKEELLMALFRLSGAEFRRASVHSAHRKLLPEWDENRRDRAMQGLLDAGDIVNIRGASCYVDISSAARRRLEYKEATSQSGPVFNIGNLTNSPLQVVGSGGHATQSTTYSNQDLRELVNFYRSNIDELQLDANLRRKADVQIATIEAQLMDEPDPTIIKAAGKSLKTIIEGAIGGALGTAISTAPMWTSLFAGF
ncbi:MAG: hypothetical protein ING71_07570 [Rhodocyclaceae bacterium]|nr:hypothetical protein [Rhodocyclaceae bacterium]